jgi:hypothetical protein
MRNKVSFHTVGFLRGTRAVVRAALICLVLSTASCRTIKTVEVPVPVHDTTYITKTERDSVFVEHSTTYYVKGDTVFEQKTVTKYIEKTKTDTVRLYVEKPIEIVKTETKTVEKPLNSLQKAFIILGGLFLLSLLFAIAIFIIGLKKK